MRDYDLVCNISETRLLCSKRVFSSERTRDPADRKGLLRNADVVLRREELLQPAQVVVPG